jgi:phosphatidylserine/phosphatidylglycerophosphate/cardiolipin synthase-like enzyme
VRVVTDSDYLDEEEVQELKEAGIPVLGDRREGSMHNKFVIIDRQEVWTGSMNLTVNDTYRNNNSLIRIRSQRLAEDYTHEFEEMFVDDLFGPGGQPDTLYPSLTVDGTRLDVYFSPDDGTASRLLELVRGARESVYVLAFSFTSDDLAEALIERARAGVKVAGVLDEGQYNSNQGGEFENLRRAGLDVRLDGNPRSLHHKVLIIDGEILVTGSYNFSNNAERVNDENTLILYQPEIARRYFEEFQKIYAQAEE